MNLLFNYVVGSDTLQSVRRPVVITRVTMAHVPVAVLVFSGKRKSGKDYVTEKLLQRYIINTCFMLCVALNQK